MFCTTLNCPRIVAGKLHDEHEMGDEHVIGDVVDGFRAFVATQIQPANGGTFRCAWCTRLKGQITEHYEGEGGCAIERLERLLETYDAHVAVEPVLEPAI